MDKLTPMNLQVFADDNTNNPDNVDDTPNNAGGADGQQNNPDDKLFTQEELDQKIKERIKREKKTLMKDMPSKDDLKEFTAWKESQKTPEDKAMEEDEELSRVKKEAEEYKSKAQAYENKDKVLKKDVPLEFAEYVAYSAGKMVDEDTDFDKALGKFLKDNPQYTDGGTNQKYKTALKHKNNPDKLDDVTTQFANALNNQI